MLPKHILVILLLLSIVASCYSAETVLSPGSEVHITVLGHGELSGTFVVDSNGMLDYPILANVPVDGLTVSQFNALLAPLLNRYVDRPLFFVNVSPRELITIQVIGQVEHPGFIESPQNVHPSLMIAQAGGFTEYADLTKIVVFRRGKEGYTSIPLQHQEYFVYDKTPQSFTFQNEDVLVVPQIDLSRIVRVFGQVNTPGILLEEANENLLDCIFRAGGFSEEAWMSKVVLYRKNNNMYRRDIYDINKVFNNANFLELPTIAAGDIIYVPDKPFYLTYEFYEKFLRMTQLLLTLYLFAVVRF